MKHPFTNIIKTLSLYSFITLALCTTALAQEPARKVTLDLKDATLKSLFEEIQRQTDLNFVYSTKDARLLKPINLQVKDKTVNAILDEVFKGSGFKYKIEGKIITIKYEKEEPKNKTGSTEETSKTRKVTGTVTDSESKPMAGVNIWLKGTRIGTFTDGEGKYTINVFNDTVSVLRFTFLGMKPKDIVCNEQQELNVTMEEDVSQIGEIGVVATGMFTRKAETFTGATSTFDSEDLKKVGNQNLLMSLKNLDPSFIINENINFGSDPNKLPDIQLRGPSSITVDLKSDYETSPNQPLFILNGFETTVEKVYDMDMNLVSKITLLKDAAAKAIYGSKAANGVVIIETIQPEAGKLRASYSGSTDITVPDLTSYNLTNASEKLQAEVLAGKYTSTNAYEQAALTEEYNELYKEIARGVNTYWMAKPLRLGVGQKHSLYLDGGDDAMKYSASLSYINNAGVMKGSARTTISGSVTLAYRHKNLSFKNHLSVDNNKGVNSPYGSFSDYSLMNPYYRVYNENGKLIKQYANSIYNPLYNAGLNSIDESAYTLITENFYGEWNAVKNLRLTARVGYSQQLSGSDVFIPASNTKYASISTSSDEYLLRGQYTKTNTQNVTISADAGAAYTLQKNKHLLYSNLLYNIEQSVSESSGMTAVGFPSDKMDYISFGSQYLDGSSPSGDESTIRSVGVIGSLNYSYDNRYLADASYRLNGSSIFGAKERWGQFWSAAVGWNIHHEAFMKTLTFVNLLKMRASIGYTGSQNFNSYQAISTYTYITKKTYNGDMGVTLLGLANDHLQWQQLLDRNLGIDMTLFKNNVSLRFDIYHSTTTNLLTDVSLPPSAGFATYRENLGETENKGYELSINYKVWTDAPSRSSVNIYFNLNHNTNKISQISDALKALNKEQDEEKENTGGTSDAKQAQQTPSTRYEEGQSMTAIWAVRSMGIDPITGQEVFLKKDGTTTFEWNTNDQVVCGDETPSFRGNIGSNIRYKGFELNFSLTYRLGGQTYNSTLVEKVENADVLNDNVDKRVLTGRWNTPGVPAKFKSITDHSITKPTSRFVEDLNEIVLSSINIGYDFSKMKWIKNSPLEYLKLVFNMNDVGRLSTVKQEFGLSYPRARVFSFSLQTRF